MQKNRLLFFLTLLSTVTIIFTHTVLEMKEKQLQEISDLDYEQQLYKKKNLQSLYDSLQHYKIQLEKTLKAYNQEIENKEFLLNQINNFDSKATQDLKALELLNMVTQKISFLSTHKNRFENTILFYEESIKKLNETITPTEKILKRHKEERLNKAQEIVNAWSNNDLKDSALKLIYDLEKEHNRKELFKVLNNWEYMNQLALQKN